MKKFSWKVALIILAILVVGWFTVKTSFKGVESKVISYEENIENAKSTINVQEKRREDLIPNLADCVKAYDKHEYETLMKVIEARGTNTDKAVEEVQTMITAVAESYPELRSSSNYKELMNELSTTENKIASSRDNYNKCITRYNQYVRKFYNPSILRNAGYEIKEYKRLNYEVSEDAPTNLFD